MEENEKQAQPASNLLFGALIVGLTSFVVWLFRLKPRPPHGQPPLQAPGPRAEPSPEAGGAPAAGAGAVLAAPPAPRAPADLAAEREPKAAIAGPPVAGEGKAPVPAVPVVPAATTRWTTPTRYMAGAGLVLAFLGLVYFSRQTLIMLIFAALIAILVRPVIGFLQRRLRFPVGLAVITSYLVVAVLLFALPLLIVPNIIAAVNSLLEIDWPGIIESLSQNLDRIAAQAPAMPIVGGIVAGPIQSLADLLANLLAGMPAEPIPTVSVQSMLSSLGRAVGLLASVLGPLVSGVLSIVFLLLISLQMSLSADHMRGWIMNVVPQRFEAEINGLLDRLLFVWTSFLRGQFALMVVMGLLVWLMNWLLGTPQALLLGLVAGLLEIIPSLGPTLAAVPAALLALLLGSARFPGLEPPIFMLIVIASYVLLNLFENQVLVPQILGDAVDLPPLIVIVGAAIGGAQAGIAGIFLSTPVIATGRELFEYVYSKILDVPEPPEEQKPSLGERVRGLAARIRLPGRRKAGRA